MRDGGIHHKQKGQIYINSLLNVYKKVLGIRSFTVDDTKKLVLYGVKYVNTQCDNEFNTVDDAERFHGLVMATHDVIGLLTPNQFVNVFPIEKKYNGYKYQSKDYFYTMNYLNSLERDKPIKDQSMDGGTVLGFLWEYCNMEVREFTVALMTSLSRLQRLNGEPTITDSLTKMLGVKSYTLCESNGKQFLLDTNGKTQRLCKKTPRYLKLIK